MRTFKLSPDEDWAVAGPVGQLDLVLVSDGAEFTRASILGRLPVQKGTWRFDPSLGIDWQALVGKVSEPFTIAAVVGELVVCEGVDAALSGDFAIVDDVDTRRRRIDGSVYSLGASLSVTIAVPT
jgi:hypothetical protein